MTLVPARRRIPGRVYVWATLATVGVLGLASFGPGNLAAEAQVQTLPLTLARSANAVVESMGVNTHFTQAFQTPGAGLYTAYSNTDQVEAALQAIGLRYIRDDSQTAAALADGGASGTSGLQLRQLYRDHGIRADLIMGQFSPSSESASVADWVAAVAGLGDVVTSVEGVNEPDVFQSNGPDWVPNARAEQMDLYKDITTNPLAGVRRLPVLGPSLCASLCGHPDYYQQLGDLSRYMTEGNMHLYPGGEPYTSKFLTTNPQLLDAPLVSGNHTLSETETGYQVGPSVASGLCCVDDATQAAYVPKTYLVNFAHGITRTYMYELIANDILGPIPQNDGYRILNDDFTPKPAATTMQQMISLLADPGPGFTPGNLAYGISSGGAGAVQSLLLQKRDGSFYLGIWQEANLCENGSATAACTPLSPPAVPISLKLGSVAGVTTSYVGPSRIASATYPPSSSFALSVPADDVLFVRLQPAAAQSTFGDASAGRGAGLPNTSAGPPAAPLGGGLLVAAWAAARKRTRRRGAGPKDANDCRATARDILGSPPGSTATTRARNGFDQWRAIPGIPPYAGRSRALSSGEIVAVHRPSARQFVHGEPR